MPRLRKFEVDELTPRQRQIYDRLVNGRRATSRTFPLTDEAGRLEGPCNAWLLSPPLGDAFELFGATIRFDLSLTPRCREIAILAVAHHRDSPYELYAHRLAGVAAGLSQAEVADLCAGRDPGLSDPAERATYAVATALLRDGGLDDAAYDSAVAALGETGLFEVTAVVGFYQLTANLLAVFDVTPPEDPPADGAAADGAAADTGANKGADTGGGAAEATAQDTSEDTTGTPEGHAARG